MSPTKSSKRSRSRSSEDEDDVDSEDDNRGTTYSNSNYASFNLHDDDKKDLNRGEFVSLAALNSGKGPANRHKHKPRTLVIPNDAASTSALLSMASQIVCGRKDCTDRSPQQFIYIQFIVSLYVFLTAAGVHEFDRLCRTYCANEDIAWCVPQGILHSLMLVVIANTLPKITVCPICGNKHCNAQTCPFTMSASPTPNKSSTSTVKPHSSSIPFKAGVCTDYQTGSCRRGQKCKFEHVCSHPSCNKVKHQYSKNH